MAAVPRLHRLRAAVSGVHQDDRFAFCRMPFHCDVPCSCSEHEHEHSQWNLHPPVRLDLSFIVCTAQLSVCPQVADCAGPPTAGWPGHAGCRHAGSSVHRGCDMGSGQRGRGLAGGPDRDGAAAVGQLASAVGDAAADAGCRDAAGDFLFIQASTFCCIGTAGAGALSLTPLFAVLLILLA